MSMVSGVSVQVSGTTKIQKTEEKGRLFLFSVLCHLTSVICYLTPDTRNLKPKIEPFFVNYLRDATVVTI
jgi:hypothetical protein